MIHGNCTSTSGTRTRRCRRHSGRARLDTFTELRLLADDLTELGDTATAALVRQAVDHFIAWKFEAGERLLAGPKERRKHEQEPPRSRRTSTPASWRSHDAEIVKRGPARSL